MMCKTLANTASHSSDEDENELHIINGQTTIDLICLLIHPNIQSSSIEHRRWRFGKIYVEHLEYHDKFHMFKQQMQLQGRARAHTLTISNVMLGGKTEKTRLSKEGRISCVDVTITKAYALNFQV